MIFISPKILLVPCRWGFFVLPSDAGVQGKLEQHIVQQDHDWLKLRGQCEVGRWPCGQQGEDVELWRGGAWRAEGQEEETEHEGEQPSFTCQVEYCFIYPIWNIVNITERNNSKYILTSSRILEIMFNEHQSGGEDTNISCACTL